MTVLSAFTSEQQVYAVSMEARRGHWSPWTTVRVGFITIWVLGIVLTFVFLISVMWNQCAQIPYLPLQVILAVAAPHI